MLFLPLDFFSFHFFSFFCPPQQLLKFLSMPFNKKTINRTNSGVQLSSKLLGRLFFFYLFFFPSFPRPWPNVKQDVNVCDRNCSVISQHWMGGRGIFSKRENFPSWRLKWTTVKLYNLPNCFYLAGIVVRRYSEGRCGATKKKAERRESRSNLVHSISGLQVKTDWGIHQELD